MINKQFLSAYQRDRNQKVVVYNFAEIGNSFDRISIC